ncbi:MAG TPA: hypothetical protein VMZ28_11950 [Kofleriaceae bacterium]|nr:hypothetical protein [Kofleriaceae bacterium]
MSDSSKTPDPTPEGVDRARRRLLGMAVYIPPTILGIVALQQAGCQPSPTCNPASCQPNTTPCNPDNNPCAPNNGCNPDNCPPNTGCNPDNCNPN